MHSLYYEQDFSRSTPESGFVSMVLVIVVKTCRHHCAVLLVDGIHGCLLPEVLRTASVFAISCRRHILTKRPFAWASIPSFFPWNAASTPLPLALTHQQLSLLLEHTVVVAFSLLSLSKPEKVTSPSSLDTKSRSHCWRPPDAFSTAQIPEAVCSRLSCDSLIANAAVLCRSRIKPSLAGSLWLLLLSTPLTLWVEPRFRPSHRAAIVNTFVVSGCFVTLDPTLRPFGQRQLVAVSSARSRLQA